MIPTPLATVASQAGGVLDAHTRAGETSRAGETTVFSVVTDNRQVEPGALFVAIAGERVDGNRFAGDALTRGAVGVLTSNRDAALEGGAAPERLIVVPDVYQALGNLAREQLALVRKNGRADFTVLAITGSVGKTTTKDLLSAILAERGPVIAPPGSFNNELGLPLTVLRADASTATLVLEMGAGAPGDLAYLTSIAAPDISVVLIVARAHMGFMGGINAVARAKQELVEGTLEGGTIVLNGDDERVTAMQTAARGPVVFFSAHGSATVTGEQASVYATDIYTDASGHAHFTLHAPDGSSRVALALVGEHQVANALASAAAAHTLGIPLAHIVKVLSETGPISAHRMRVSECGSVTLIDDSYNANPDSARAGINAAIHIAGGQRRVVAVLGHMAELGQTSAAEHEALGEFAAQVGVTTLVAVGDGTNELVCGARSAGVPDVHQVSSTEAPRFVPSLLRDGDVVLVKGSHSSQVWTVADTLLKHLDASGVSEAEGE